MSPLRASIVRIAGKRLLFLRAANNADAIDLSNGRRPEARTGSTLAEVMVALLVMSIGLVSVATVFPISVMRSVKASQKTQSTILKQNAEAYVDATRWYPQLDSRNILSDPRLYVGPDLAFGAAGVDEDGDGTTDNRTEQGWTNTDDRGLAVFDPLGVLELNTHIFPYGATGAAALPRLNGILPYGRGVNPFVPPLPLTAASAWTGYDDARFRRAAEDLSYLPDSYVNRFESSTVTAGSTPDYVVVPGIVTGGISGTFQVTDAPTRIVLTDVTGRLVQVRTICRVVSDKVYFTEDDNGNNQLDVGEDRNFNNVLDTNPLPAGFSPSGARVETQDQRFSWMLLIRRAGSDYCDIDVVVFLWRNLVIDTSSPANNDEYVYDGVQGASEDVVVFASAPKNAKQGGFLISTYPNLECYLVDSIAADGKTMKLSRADTTDQRSVDFDRTGNFSAVFMRGIVDSYPLGVRTPW